MSAARVLVNCLVRGLNHLLKIKRDLEVALKEAFRWLEIKITWTKTILATIVRVLSGIRERLCMLSSSLNKYPLKAETRMRTI